MSELNHGTYSTYVNRKCRCDECREAARTYQREASEKRRGGVPAKRGRPAKPIEHGTFYSYQKGCRCDDCKTAQREYYKSRKVGLPEGDSRHGTTNGYINLGCRCDLCREAVVTYRRVSGDGRRSALKRNYGMTPEQWDGMFEAQGGVCASCGTAPKETAKRRFHVDHDHDTGAVRAILCHGCNVALGQLGEDPERIRALADYIEGFKPF